MSKYVFKPYDPIFPILFENEKKRLFSYLAGNYRIEHVGSTAVPNLGGKGIIDIYIVTAKENLERLSAQLLKASYEYRPRVSTDQHVFHRIDLPDPIEGKRRYHIHLNHFNSKDFLNAIKFRDYLQKHPEEANRYAHVKKKAVKNANGNKDTYMRIKASVIEDVLRKTLDK